MPAYLQGHMPQIALPSERSPFVSFILQERHINNDRHYFSSVFTVCLYGI